MSSRKLPPSIDDQIKECVNRLNHLVADAGRQGIRVRYLHGRIPDPALLTPVFSELPRPYEPSPDADFGACYVRKRGRVPA